MSGIQSICKACQKAAKAQRRGSKSAIRDGQPRIFSRLIGTLRPETVEKLADILSESIKDLHDDNAI